MSYGIDCLSNENDFISLKRSLLVLSILEIVFTDHAICLTIYWLNQSIIFYSAARDENHTFQKSHYTVRLKVVTLCICF